MKYDLTYSVVELIEVTSNNSIKIMVIGEDVKSNFYRLSRIRFF